MVKLNNNTRTRPKRVLLLTGIFLAVLLRKNTMERVNIHIHDEHWWVYIHHPVQSVLLLICNILITYYAIKNLKKVNIESIVLILLSYLAFFIMVRYSEDEVSLFPFFWSIFSSLLSFMKIKYHESRKYRDFLSPWQFNGKIVLLYF